MSHIVNYVFSINSRLYSLNTFFSGCVENWSGEQGFSNAFNGTWWLMRSIDNDWIQKFNFSYIRLDSKFLAVNVNWCDLKTFEKFWRFFKALKGLKISKNHSFLFLLDFTLVLVSPSATSIFRFTIWCYFFAIQTHEYYQFYQWVWFKLWLKNGYTIARFNFIKWCFDCDRIRCNMLVKLMRFKRVSIIRISVTYAIGMTECWIQWNGRIMNKWIPTD